MRFIDGASFQKAVFPKRKIDNVYGQANQTMTNANFQNQTIGKITETAKFQNIDLTNGSVYSPDNQFLYGIMTKNGHFTNISSSSSQMPMIKVENNAYIEATNYANFLFSDKDNNVFIGGPKVNAEMGGPGSANNTFSFGGGNDRLYLETKRVVTTEIDKGSVYDFGEGKQDRLFLDVEYQKGQFVVKPSEEHEGYQEVWLGPNKAVARVANLEYIVFKDGKTYDVKNKRLIRS